ncbi:plasmid mobilization relaxosome protein MobC [Ancylomarina longa]|uniref:Plasmid mobilization relaxosome protein MobC n=1 Tax=Ancylomarina longa TaxID=2487017 RepID=A0A434AVE5_9BACT|nr:plasmid mobilization relaxosome protein MobC [Ancylomarina longa]
MEGKYKLVYRDETRDEMLYELGKVTTNLNQIAHRLNIDNAPNLTGEDVLVLKELREILLHYNY